MELYVVRHGTTDWNAEARFQGCKDIPLNQNGRDLAADLGKRLADTTFDYYFSSPLQRAYETLDIVRKVQMDTRAETCSENAEIGSSPAATGSSLPEIVTDQRLIELFFGELEGLPFAEWMNTDEPRKNFFDAPDKYVPPKGGETFPSAMARSKDFVQSVIEPIYTKNPDARILLVAHGALLAALTCYLENRNVAHYWGAGLKGNCQAAIYSFDGKNWSLAEDSKPAENIYKKAAGEANNATCADIVAKDFSGGVKVTNVLNAGGVVIIPTDTVYGFSGIVNEYDTIAGEEKNASDKNKGTEDEKIPTDDRIRGIKGRAESKPLIQLIARPEDIRKYTDDEIPSALLDKWPGALTIIVHLKKELPLAAVQPTVAFRCPGDQWLRDIIATLGKPIYSTSVNRSGQPVLDSADAIINEFGSEVDLIIDDGDKKGALPSTLVSIENGQVKVLRQGSVQV